VNPDKKASPHDLPWLRWSSLLKDFGFADLASSLSEAGKPIAPVFAQLLYLADPFVDDPSVKARIDDLATSLEGHPSDQKKASL